MRHVEQSIARGTAVDGLREGERAGAPGEATEYGRVAQWDSSNPRDIRSRAPCAASRGRSGNAAHPKRGSRLAPACE
ncbi:Hypothetical protein A7982_09945 [Minicystis rosea]|nr:Hypothetical protein A7982_09945 [Minicystis rosea]